MSDEKIVSLQRLRDILGDALDVYRDADIDPPYGIEIGRELTAVRSRVEALLVIARMRRPLHTLKL